MYWPTVTASELENRRLCVIMKNIYGKAVLEVATRRIAQMSMQIQYLAVGYFAVRGNTSARFDAVTYFVYELE